MSKEITITLPKIETIIDITALWLEIERAGSWSSYQNTDFWSWFNNGYMEVTKK